MYRLFILFILVFSLNAYELPKVELPQNGKPEIVFFEATSVLVDEKPAYTLRWKTINATDVNITFLGAIELSGSLTITEGEYNHGAITLHAYSKSSKYSDTIIINHQNKDLPPPIIFDKPEEVEQPDQYYYNTMPYRRGINPYNRRRYY